MPCCALTCFVLQQFGTLLTFPFSVIILGAWRFISPGHPQVHHEALQRRQGREGRQPAPEDGPARRCEEQLPEAEQGTGSVWKLPSG